MISTSHLQAPFFEGPALDVNDLAPGGGRERFRAIQNALVKGPLTRADASWTFVTTNLVLPQHRTVDVSTRSATITDGLELKQTLLSASDSNIPTAGGVFVYSVRGLRGSAADSDWFFYVSKSMKSIADTHDMLCGNTAAASSVETNTIRTAEQEAFRTYIIQLLRSSRSNPSTPLSIHMWWLPTRFAALATGYLLGFLLFPLNTEDQSQSRVWLPDTTMSLHSSSGKCAPLCTINDILALEADIREWFQDKRRRFKRMRKLLGSICATAYSIKQQNLPSASAAEELNRKAKEERVLWPGLLSSHVEKQCLQRVALMSRYRDMVSTWQLFCPGESRESTGSTCSTNHDESSASQDDLQLALASGVQERIAQSGGLRAFVDEILPWEIRRLSKLETELNRLRCDDFSGN